MELRGFISIGENINLTCCESLSDINVGNESLYKILDNEFELDPALDFDSRGEENVDPFIGVSYLILDEEPDPNESYESIVGNWLVKKLYSSYVPGCYSEYTCGYGGYDYFIDGGHSLFKELSSYVDKYVLLEIKDQRDILIDNVLKK